MIDKKVVLTSVLAAIVVGTAVIGIYSWLSKESWDLEGADNALHKLNDLYLNAVTSHPDNKDRADFQFQLKAADLRAEFSKDNSKFSEYASWLIRFDDKVKNYRNKIQKG